MSEEARGRVEGLLARSANSAEGALSGVDPEIVNDEILILRMLDSVRLAIHALTVATLEGHQSYGVDP